MHSLINIEINSLVHSMIFLINDDIKYIQIDFKYLEKIVNSEFYFDRSHQIFIDIHANQGDDSKRKELINDLNQLSKDHYVWTKFKLELDRSIFRQYSSMIDLIKTYKYENTKRKEKLRISHILDGHTVSLKIENNHKTKNFEIKTPCYESHPKLMLFLKESLKIFTSNFDVNREKIIEF